MKLPPELFCHEGQTAGAGCVERYLSVPSYLEPARERFLWEAVLLACHRGSLEISPRMNSCRNDAMTSASTAGMGKPRARPSNCCAAMTSFLIGDFLDP